MRDSSGFALFVVICTVGLLALAAAAFSNMARVHVKIAASNVETARAEALAEAGINLAVLNLLSVPVNSSRRLPDFVVGGWPLRCRLNADLLVIRTQDEGGKIDLNFGSERILRALLVGLGVGPAQAAAHVDSILDYRDGDGVKRPNGAEGAEYLAAGRPHGPKNAPFVVVEELEQVLGLDRDLIERMLPFVTTYSGKDGVDPETATKRLTEFLLEGDRYSHPGDALDAMHFAPQAFDLPAHFAAPSQRAVFTIKVEVLMAGGASFIREAIVDISPTRVSGRTPGQPYRILRWHRINYPSSNSALAAPDNEAPPC